VAARKSVLSLVVLLGLGAPALACQGTGTPQLDENFKTPDPGWGRPDDVGTFTPNGLALTAPVNGSAWRINRSYTLGTADWGVEAVNPARPRSLADEAGDVGIWFWGLDSQNFYTATIALDGTAAIDRLAGGKWQAVVPPTASSAIKTAPNAVNEIEVVLRGGAGTLFVNGGKITDFRGQAPPDGGSPGVYAESGPDGSTWVFARARLF